MREMMELVYTSIVAFVKMHTTLLKGVNLIIYK